MRIKAIGSARGLTPFTMREIFAPNRIPALLAHETMLAPRLNEGCPLARVTSRAARAGGRATGDVVHSAGLALWGLTNQQVPAVSHHPEARG